MAVTTRKRESYQQKVNRRAVISWTRITRRNRYSGLKKKTGIERHLATSGRDMRTDRKLWVSSEKESHVDREDVKTVPRSGVCENYYKKREWWYQGLSLSLVLGQLTHFILCLSPVGDYQERIVADKLRIKRTNSVSCVRYLFSLRGYNGGPTET